MSRQLRPSPVCLNCGVAVATRFCANCGQENTTYRVSLGRLLGNLFEELFQLESRLWRTLWALFRRPGLLTREYNAGRRVSYTTPLRLYLTASVVYFFVVGFMPQRIEDDKIKFEVPELSELQQAKMDAAPAWARFLYERSRQVQADPHGSVTRMRRTISEWAPRIAAGLVPLLAFLTWLCFRRPKRYFVEHLVFALHLHAAAFFLLAVSAVLPWGPVGVVVWLALMALLFLSARAVFEQSRVATAFKLVAIGLVYSIFLGLGIAGAGAFGLLSKS